MNRSGRVLLLASLFVGWVAGNAGAATFTVSRTTDTADGTCDSDCSLREAVIASNQLPGPDTISLPPGTYVLTIPGIFEAAALTGDLDILDGVSIIGASSGNTIIDGGALDQVFQIHASPSGIVIFSDLTIQGASSANDGGGIFNGVATVHVIRSVIRNNTTGGSGGGIVNDSGILTLTECVVRDNRANGSAGGVGSGGPLTILRSQILNNHAGSAGGGGGLSTSGRTTIVSTTIDGNTAGLAGGIFGASGTLPANEPQILQDSTVSNNSAERDGGGLFSHGMWTITNCTISGNTSAGIGGGIRAIGGAWTIVNSTLNLSSAAVGGGISTAGSSTVSLRNTIVANSPVGGNCDGALISAGNNLSSDGTCASSFTAPGDRNDTAPLLGPLADHGGFTQTHALLPGSPAIDTAGGCPPPATDQRGVARPQGVACDVGSFEVEAGTLPAGIPTLSVAAMVVVTLVLAVAGGWIARR